MVLLLALSFDALAGCRSDCKDEYEAEVRSCESLYDALGDSDRLTKCLENAKDRFPPALGIGTVYRCMVNNKSVFTDQQLNPSCQLLNIPVHAADPEEVARQLQEHRGRAEEHGEFIRALEAEQAARAEWPRAPSVVPRADEDWET